jgi:hypothetical protein
MKDVSRNYFINPASGGANPAHPAMKTFFPALLALTLSVFLGGCNEFTYSYKPTATNAELAPYSGKTETMFTTAGDIDRDAKMLESHGCICLGTSSFTTTDLVTINQVQSQGKKVGADLVLWTSDDLGSTSGGSFFETGGTSGSGPSGADINAYGDGPSTAPSNPYGVYDNDSSTVQWEESTFQYTASFWRKPQGDSADATVESIIVAETYDARGMTYGGWTMAEIANGHHDRTLADFTQVIEANPAAAYDIRGDTENAKGDFDGAIADFTKAIELNPNDAIAYYHRAFAKDKKGDFDGASADCNQGRRFITIKPSN